MLDSCSRVTIIAESWIKIFKKIETNIVTFHKEFTRSSPGHITNQNTHALSIQANHGFPGLPLCCHLQLQYGIQLQVCAWLIFLTDKSN